MLNNEQTGMIISFLRIFKSENKNVHFRDIWLGWNQVSVKNCLIIKTFLSVVLLLLLIPSFKLFVQLY